MGLKWDYSNLKLFIILIRNINLIRYINLSVFVRNIPLHQIGY